MDWYPWYPTAFKRKTYRLTLAEDGAYRRLIDEYMTLRGALPDDDNALARILGVSLEEWQAVAPKVRSFFRSKDEGLRHKRCEEELAAQNAKMKRYSERGKKAAFAKYSNPNWLPARRMLVPATIHKKDITTTESGAAKGSSEGNGIASSELASIVSKKWRQA